MIMPPFDVNSFCQRRTELFGWVLNQLVYTHPDIRTRRSALLTTEEIMQLFHSHLADSLRELNAISLERQAQERLVRHAPVSQPEAERTL